MPSTRPLAQPPAPKFITFTGVDADTDPAGMVHLVDDYPGRIEWGILFSPKRQGNEPRYPKLDAIHWLVEEIELTYSAHLCGQDARDVLRSGCSRHENVIRHFFKRAQINTVEQADTWIISVWAKDMQVQPILQCRSSFPYDSNVQWLYDTSGGRGLSPEGWPIPAGGTCVGYAGGLNPDNVAEHVRRIGGMFERRPESSYWIDMESGVRDENDRFSLDKCRAVCEAVYGAPQSTP